MIEVIPKQSMKPAEHPSRKETTYAQHGLSLPSETLGELRKRGVSCYPSISLEHQHLAKRYVLRATESGGSAPDMGRYCGYVNNEGAPIPYLYPIDSFAFNGRHAVIIAEELVRIEMFRFGRTYQLAITQHALQQRLNQKRPVIVPTLLYLGQNGFHSVDLTQDENRILRGKTAPTFYSRSGEESPIPLYLLPAVHIIAGAVCCVGCKHSHLSGPIAG